MNLTDEMLKQLDNPALTPERRTLLRCRFAAELIHTGQHEAALAALGELWKGIGKRPELRGLTTSVAAEVLLQCGVLSGWLGSKTQSSDAQESAKDLLTESLRKFKSQGQQVKVSEVQYELGLCYFRLGAYNEARIVLDEALKTLADRDITLKAKIFIRRIMVEIWTSRYHEAWCILKESQEFFENCNDAIRGRWHGHRGLILRRLATAEGSTEYADRAIIEFTAAAYHFEQAHHESYSARALNNIAMLLHKLGRYDEAHENLDRATEIFVRLKDEGALAQVKETRARVLVAQGRYVEAERVVGEAVRVFEQGGEFGLLADALAIQGVAWARLGRHEGSMEILRRAMEVAYDSGALSNAGLAALTFVEEHGEGRLTGDDLYDIYRRADEWLTQTQDAEEISRLRACARLVMRKLSMQGATPRDEGFSLPEAMRAYESKLIAISLEAEAGSVTRAARRLGVTHQSLIQTLKSRHKNLLHKRTPAVARRRSLFKFVEPHKAGRAADVSKERAYSILLVEDNLVLAGALKEALEAEGWAVEAHSDGSAALRRIESHAHFDLLIIDDGLPGVSGLELARRARSLMRRRRTPVVVLSTEDVEAQAWRVGADAFLRKPDDIGDLNATVRRLLPQTNKGDNP